MWTKAADLQNYSEEKEDCKGFLPFLHRNGAIGSLPGQKWVRNPGGLLLQDACLVFRDASCEARQAVGSESAVGEAAPVRRRLAELDREWDIERTLEANAAALGLLGLSLGATVNRKWFVLPAIISGFLLQHALQGWYPPVEVFRRLGYRTRAVHCVQPSDNVGHCLGRGVPFDAHSAKFERLLRNRRHCKLYGYMAQYSHQSEVPRRLVGLLVFKTSAPVTSWWVGSIPTHFRQYNFNNLQLQEKVRRSRKDSGRGFGGSSRQPSNFFTETTQSGLRSRP